jgi:hypothetical protein
VKILYRQQLSIPFCQPLDAGRTLTLRATAIATGVVRDGAMSAIVILHMATQDVCAAITNVVEGFPLWAGEYPLPQSQKVISVSAEDIGHFQPMLTHFSG